VDTFLLDRWDVRSSLTERPLVAAFVLLGSTPEPPSWVVVFVGVAVSAAACGIFIVHSGRLNDGLLASPLGEDGFDESPSMSLKPRSSFRSVPRDVRRGDDEDNGDRVENGMCASTPPSDDAAEATTTGDTGGDTDMPMF
jgi:hypothetical protein